MSRSSSKISRGKASDLIGMFNNMSTTDEQQDPNLLTPRGVASGVSSSSSGLGADTNNSSVIRKSSRSLSPSPFHIRLSTSPSSSLSPNENNRNHQIGLSKTTDCHSFGSSFTLSPLQSRQRKVSAYVTSMTPPPPITVDEARSRKASAMANLMPTKSALKSKSAYDNPTEKNVPALNENRSDNHDTTLHPTLHHQEQQQSDMVNKEPDKIHDYQSYDNSNCSSVDISGYSNRNPRLLLPETDMPLRKVSALAALCPTNVNPTPSKQVTISPSPSTISINLSGCIKTDQEDLNENLSISSGRRGSGQNGLGRSKSFKCHRVKFGPSAVYDISGPSEQHQQESEQQLPYYLRRPKQFPGTTQGTSPYGIGIQDTEGEPSNSRKNSSRNSPFEKFRQMEQNKEDSQSSDRQSRLSRQASLPSVYNGENGNPDKPGDRRGIPVGSAPPPVNFSSSQTSQLQQARYTPSAPMIRSKTSHGIGQNPQGAKISSAPGSPMPDASKPTRMIARSPSSAKEMLLVWVQQRVNTYPGMNVTNFSSCWNDGIAFCALIHFYYPRAFDFTSLESKNRRHNFTLAFEMAEKLADICPLLEVDDMVRFQKPDWKCVFTYVQSFYRRFRNVPLPQKLDSKEGDERVTSISSSIRPTGNNQLAPTTDSQTYNKSLGEATGSMAHLSTTTRHDTTVGDKHSDEKRIE